MTRPVSTPVRLRGIALLSCAICWCIYGIGVITDPRVGLSRGVQVLLSVCPITCWGAIWITCGIVAAAFAVIGPPVDRFGFAAAALPPASWAVAFNVAWLSGDYPQAWTAVPAWLIPLALLGVIAALSARYTALQDRIKQLEEQISNGHH